LISFNPLAVTKRGCELIINYYFDFFALQTRYNIARVANARWLAVNYYFVRLQSSIPLANPKSQLIPNIQPYPATSCQPPASTFFYPDKVFIFALMPLLAINC